MGEQNDIPGLGLQLSMGPGSKSGIVSRLEFRSDVRSYSNCIRDPKKEQPKSASTSVDAPAPRGRAVARSRRGTVNNSTEFAARVTPVTDGYECHNETTSFAICNAGEITGRRRRYLALPRDDIENKDVLRHSNIYLHPIKGGKALFIKTVVTAFSKTVTMTKFCDRVRHGMAELRGREYNDIAEPSISTRWKVASPPRPAYARTTALLI
ncbi:hypothetical protein EVAR_4114_1 [Eumeta japonica]|uniref:Uncharacterized protein n=1 Tax=Eumeta variegata TaxID=151549 RepID=A0A4C1T4X5_EUMVA|nr:hypothetical protein EVAR_4114_1 [Eumeta japonica]